MVILVEITAIATATSLGITLCVYVRVLYVYAYIQHIYFLCVFFNPFVLPSHEANKTMINIDTVFLLRSKFIVRAVLSEKKAIGGEIGAILPTFYTAGSSLFIFPYHSRKRLI